MINNAKNDFSIVFVVNCPAKEKILFVAMLGYFYVVYGERKDIGKLDIEVIDAEYSDESTD